MTASEISARVLARLDDSAASPGSVAADSQGGPVPPEILSALNEAQETFAWLTLCLETTATLTITGGATFASLRTTFPDYLVPLRLMIDGVRVRPATLSELDAENSAWEATVGTPARYEILGFNYYAITPQPAIDTAASFTYARSPAQMVGDSFIEIPEQFSPALVAYGVYRVKVKEGAQGLERGIKYLNEFLDAATVHGDFVRAKSRAARYDTLPIEVRLFDRSRLMPAKKKG